MLQVIFFIKLLLVHYATQSQRGIEANCNDDVTLKCPHNDIDSMDFLSVIWYKVKDKQKFGLLRKRKGEQVQAKGTAKLGEKYSLLLFGVTVKDSGTYDCTVMANIGYENLYSEVNLTVHECVTKTVVTPVTTVLNINQSTEPCPVQVQDLPLMWTIIGFVAVGLLKIVLSLISIWVNKLFFIFTHR
ncbi:CD83 antigen precursor [Solea senegalensis]|uniref:CD83 antigen n=1 Tax=Solea senegalensis TaxID=28829 RepID=A0AAV6SQN2_SOLSE|nr:CD83 antigen precursor [Solea senegalensis]